VPLTESHRQPERVEFGKNCSYIVLTVKANKAGVSLLLHVRKMTCICWLNDTHQMHPLVDCVQSKSGRIFLILL